MTQETFSAILALGGVVYAASIGLLIAMMNLKKAHQKSELQLVTVEAEKLRIETRLVQKRYEFIEEVTHPLVSLVYWQPVVDAINALMLSSAVDRVLLLTAINGIQRPTHTSAVWQIRLPSNDIVPYINQPIDDDYVDRLFLMKRSRFIRFKTVDLPNSAFIKGCYLEEGVTESVWVLLGTKANADTGQLAYKYVSFSTHDERGYTDEDVRRIQVVSAELKNTIRASGFSSIII